MDQRVSYTNDRITVFDDTGIPLSLHLLEGTAREGVTARWSGLIGANMISVEVRNIDFKSAEDSYPLLISEVFVDVNVSRGAELPYAGAEIERQLGKIWFMATIHDKPNTILIKGLPMLSQRQLEDAFNNATAVVSWKPIEPPGGVFRVPDVGHGPRKLPEFKGYTIDYRLRQFRKAELGRSLEFISFDSPEGQKLLADMGVGTQIRQIDARGWSGPEVRRLFDQYPPSSYRTLTVSHRHKPTTYADIVEFRARAAKEGAAVIVIQEHGQTAFVPIRGEREVQTEEICPACSGPGMSMGVLGRKEWFRCRNCGMEWHGQARGGRVPQVPATGAAPATDLGSQIQKLWQAGNIKEFFIVLNTVNSALEERKRGQTKLYPDLSVGDLENVRDEADRLRGDSSHAKR